MHISFPARFVEPNELAAAVAVTPTRKKEAEEKTSDR